MEDLDIRMIGNYTFMTLNEINFNSTHGMISVPSGFMTDLASVPRAFWSIFPPHGRYAKASVVHDYMYTNAIKTKKIADLVFLEAMEDLEVPYWRRKIIYLAVRLFGRGKY